MKLKKTLLIILIFLFLTFSLTAKNRQNIKNKASKILETDFAVANILDYDFSEDGEWFFANAQTAGTYTNNVYVVNLLQPERSVLVYKNHLNGKHTVTDLAYNPANKTLYFMVDNGNESPLGIRTYEGSGFYALSPDSEGNYITENLRRYYRLDFWVVDAVVKNYLTLPATPDYKGFCDFFTNFADYSLRDKAYFCLKDADGKLLTGENAAKYILDSGALEDFIYQTNKWGAFPLEKYVFVGEQPAVSYDFCGSKVITSSRSDFFVLNGTVYFTYNYGSFDSDGNWKLNFASIYEIRDDESGFYIDESDLLSKIQARPFEWNNNSFSPVEDLYDKNDKITGVLIQDCDGQTEWYFDGSKVEKYADQQTFDVKVLLILVILILCIVVCLLLVKLEHKNRLSSGVIYDIQEAEREKIAGDIHDSVVQDLRAIRIKAEMLGADQVVDEITLCITKMRDICYGLSPAELKVFDDDNDRADFYSIVQTLGEQFMLRTNIPCTVKGSSVILQKDDCRNLVRIVQEALKNIEKHSFATQTQILISGNDEEKGELKIFITDNGRGCDLKK
ncbi:MAG: hypothetical protein K5829_01445, partial [Treponema sp.]|nr:hypothetical protein [Treponema sp.]